jgi:hypothetical protein
MGYKPSDAFLGVIDVFVVLLPGAMLFALLAFVWGPAILTKFPSDALHWSVLVVMSYLAGHLVSGIGALVEDRWSTSEYAQTRFAREARDIRPAAAQILERLLGNSISKVPNLRRVAAVFVHLKGKAISTLLIRKDADRRFFRNVNVVLAAAAIWWIVAIAFIRSATIHDAIGIAVIAILLPLSLSRYFHLDANYTRDAFEYLIVLDSLGLLSRKESQQAV